MHSACEALGSLHSRDYCGYIFASLLVPPALSLSLSFSTPPQSHATTAAGTGQRPQRCRRWWLLADWRRRVVALVDDDGGAGADGLVTDTSSTEPLHAVSPLSTVSPLHGCRSGGPAAFWAVAGTK